MIRHCLAALLLALLFGPFLPAKEVRTAAEINYSCSLQQGFNFSTGNQDIVGHLVSITIAGTVIPANFTILKNPLNPLSTITAVGVISSISWGGGAADPITIGAQVSTQAKTALTTLLHASLVSTVVDFKFVIYEYDPLHHSYFQALHSNTVTLHGLIQKSGGELAINISSDPGSEVASPANYFFVIGIMPQAIEQSIYYGVAVGSTTVKKWGISESEPVELVDFTAQPSAGGVVLSWKTATEVDAYGFDVERKEAGGSVWTKLGFVPASGTSNVPHDYSWHDAPRARGAYCYRLKAIDRDGQFEYSKTVEANVTAHPTEFVLHQNFPNPFNPSTLIRYDLPVSTMVSLKIYDQAGREIRTLVNEVKPAGSHVVRWDGRDKSGRMAASGCYFYTLKTSARTEVMRMFLIK